MQAQRQLLSALGNVAGLLQDRRSLEQFVDQVDRWREEATRASFAGSSACTVRTASAGSG